MALDRKLQNSIYDYCNNHLADSQWYLEEFEFIADEQLRGRLVAEFKAIRFAYKLFEAIEAKEENLLFQVRSQILSYATLYEAIIHYVLYNYYQNTEAFKKMSMHTVPVKISVPTQQREKLDKLFHHDGKELYIFYYKEEAKKEREIRFESKCNAAKELGLIHGFTNQQGEFVDLPEEIIDFYKHRNGIHIIAEQKRGLQYEIELSKKAYWRMRPFVDQIKQKLREDGRII